MRSDKFEEWEGGTNVVFVVKSRVFFHNIPRIRKTNF